MRVIQWGTGHVGTLALRAIIGHPDLELAGVIVHSDAKAGRDAAELCGLREPTGVRATTDAAALLADGADCVSYTATADMRPNEAVRDICDALRAGCNAVSTSVVTMVYPPAGDQRQRELLEQACREGGTSCFTSGIDPGFANGLIPLVLSGFSERIESVRAMEILNYATYDQPDVLFDIMGFGRPLDHVPILLMPGILSFAWGGPIRMVADALGVELEEVREVVERRPADKTVTYPVGTVEQGTMAGLRFEIQGIVDGRPAIVIEHVTRMDDDVAPDWPQPTGAGSYRVIVTGEPSIECELRFLGADSDHNTGGLIATAMAILNAIPAVVAAPPGLLSTLDLPLVTGRHLLR